MLLARVMIVAMALLGLGQHAFAGGCTCSIPGGECGRGWSSGQVSFPGKATADIATEAPVVEDSEMTSAEVLFPGAAENLPMNHEVHFSIAESFRADGPTGQEIVVHTGVDERGPRDGDCFSASIPFSMSSTSIRLELSRRVLAMLRTCAATFTGRLTL